MNLTDAEYSTLIEIVSDAIDVGVREWTPEGIAEGGGAAYEETLDHIRSILDKLVGIRRKMQCT